MEPLQNEPVLILYNRPEPGARESEAGVLDQVDAFRSALAELGIPCRLEPLAALAELPRVLDRGRERLVINLVESFPSRPFESDAVPLVCETYGRSCTGASAAGLLLSLDKARTKDALARAGLTCPAGYVVAPGEEPSAVGALPAGRRGRMIVKPLRTDASEGIDPSAIVDSASPALRRAVAWVHEQFGQPALIEEFIEGRELNVSLVERLGQPEVLPIAEIDFSAFPPGEPRIVDYSAKWLPGSFAFHHTPRILPADLPEATAQAVRRAAVVAWHALGCRDYTRVDFRLAEDGTLYALEANLNPDVSPDAGFAAALTAWGLPFPQFVRQILDNARTRIGLPAVAPAPRTAPGSSADGTAPGSSAPAVPIRRSLPEDRDAILELLDATGFFPPGDMEIAREVLDEALEKGEAGHYQSYTACAEDGRPIGWACFGATPCTVGTWDFYWLGVDTRIQARGVGSALLRLVERLAREQGGRLMVIETSGRPLYHPTRQFYLNRGYREEGRIRDFYAGGDDRVIYTRRLR